MSTIDEPLTASHLARRAFLRRAGLSALAFVPGRRLLAADNERRVLSFVHTHTGERLTVAYYESGNYVSTALARCNELLRDFRTETVFPIDTALFDQLFALRTLAGSTGAFHVISAFRSPATNAALRSRSKGVAAHSLHMDGRAIDVRLPGIKTSRLALLARRQQWGGVGFYNASDFVHLDTGRARIWGDPTGA